MDQSDAAKVLALACIVLVIVVPLALAIGAVILRIACRMCGVKEPSFLLAMGVVLLNQIINGIIGFGIGMVVGLGAAASQMNPKQVEALAPLVQLMTLPVNMLISAGIYCLTLENVSYGKGILIWLAQLLIIFLIALVFGVVIFAFVMLATISRR